MVQKVICKECGYEVEKSEAIKIKDRCYVCKICAGTRYEQCEDCGKHIKKNRVRYGNLGIYCNDCFSKHISYCNSCSTYHKKEDMVKISEYHEICKGCFDKKYAKCEKCNKLIDKNGYDVNLLYDKDGKEKYYCSSCYHETYAYCEGCRKDILIEDTVVVSKDNQRFCKKCLKNMFKCKKCGKFTFKHEMSTKHKNICENCAKDFYKTKPYSYKSNINFLKTEQDIKDNNKMYFGFELEVSGNPYFAEDYLSFFEDDEKEVCLTTDSSIVGGGFEITSQPMTYNYFKEHFSKNFSESLKFLRENDFRSHNFGGLHIHTSKNIWSYEQLAELSLILYGSQNDINTWLLITQRKKDVMRQYASMDNLLNTYQMIAAGKCISKERYTAANVTETTIEFRIFNGNLRYERFMKNLECVFALYDFTASVVRNFGRRLPYCNTGKFLRYVLANYKKYPHLHEFIVERDIYNKYKEGITQDELCRIAA